jgi:hypothetical protein
MDFTNFYYRQWKEAEKDGNKDYIDSCKEHYRRLVMEKITQPYNYVHDKLRMYPMINLN